MTKPLADLVATAAPKQPAKRIQISRKVRRAVALMVWDGLNRAEAAEKAGLSESALYKALRLPKVKALMAQEFTELRSAAPFEAYRNIKSLGDDAKSEDVKLRANVWIAGVDGLAPASKVQISGKVTHGFENYAYQGGATIDGTATEDGE